MGINLRDIDRAMPERLLNELDIHIRLQKACGKSMAEHMGRDMHFYGGKSAVFAYHSPDGLIGEGLAGLIGEKVAA